MAAGADHTLLRHDESGAAVEVPLPAFRALVVAADRQRALPQAVEHLRRGQLVVEHRGQFQREPAIPDLSPQEILRLELALAQKLRTGLGDFGDIGVVINNQAWRSRVEARGHHHHAEDQTGKESHISAFSRVSERRGCLLVKSDRSGACRSAEAREHPAARKTLCRRERVSVSGARVHLLRPRHRSAAFRSCHYPPLLHRQNRQGILDPKSLSNWFSWIPAPLLSAL